MVGKKNEEDYHSSRTLSFHSEWIRARFCNICELIETVTHSSTNARSIESGCNNAAKHFLSCGNK